LTVPKFHRFSGSSHLIILKNCRYSNPPSAPALQNRVNSTKAQIARFLKQDQADQNKLPCIDITRWWVWWLRSGGPEASSRVKTFIKMFREGRVFLGGL
jgi:hypothetical protein